MCEKKQFFFYHQKNRGHFPSSDAQGFYYVKADWMWVQQDLAQGLIGTEMELGLNVIITVIFINTKMENFVVLEWKSELTVPLTIHQCFS